MNTQKTDWVKRVYHEVISIERTRYGGYEAHKLSTKEVLTRANDLATIEKRLLALNYVNWKFKG